MNSSRIPSFVRSIAHEVTLDMTTEMLKFPLVTSTFAILGDRCPPFTAELTGLGEAFTRLAVIQFLTNKLDLVVQHAAPLTKQLGNKPVTPCSRHEQLHNAGTRGN